MARREQALHLKNSEDFREFTEKMLRNRNFYRTAVITDSNNLPENFLINQEITECIMAAIDNLPAAMKETAFLYLIEKLPLDTLAKQLNCPIGTVRSRTSRIRKHIRKILTD